MTIGTAAQPLRIAIVGSGPSGFYAAEALLDSSHCVEVDMIERLPVPYGLVRHGVAPDHAKLKSVTSLFDSIARREGFRLFGNVEMGRDVTAAQLQAMYHAVIVATGADGDRALDIPGEELDGVHAAADFVGWYNGRPECANLRFDLREEVVAVIGQGNVAIDVCRLLALPVSALCSTDIAGHALDALAGSRVREIHLIGRRGPAQAKFTPKELRELGALPGWQVIVDPAALELNDASCAEAADPGSPFIAKNLQVLRGFASQSRTASRAIHLHFERAPVAMHGEGRVQALMLRWQRLEGQAGHQRAVQTEREERLEAGLVFRSVGYRGSSLPGLPFDAVRGVIPNTGGRVTDECGSILPGWYATGWIKRGPTGLIGTNRLDSVETVERLVEDLPLLGVPRLGRAALQAALAERGKRVISFDDWLVIERAERENGQRSGKLAEKFVNVAHMLDAVQRSRVEVGQC